MNNTLNIKTVEIPNSCNNCKYLQWGIEEGWDECYIDEHKIMWGNKQRQVCEHHTFSKVSDPRSIILRNP